MNSRQILVWGVARQYSLTGLILLPKSYCCQQRVVLFLPSAGNTLFPPPSHMLALLLVSTVSQCSLFSSWQLTQQKREPFLGGLGSPSGLLWVWMSTRVGSREEWCLMSAGHPIRSALLLNCTLQWPWEFGKKKKIKTQTTQQKTRKEQYPKTPIDFALKQLRRTLNSPGKALILVWNAVSSATTAVSLSEHIFKWIAIHHILVLTGAPAIMQKAPFLFQVWAHRQKTAWEQWQRFKKKISFPHLRDFSWFESDHRRRVPSQQDVGKSDNCFGKWKSYWGFSAGWGIAKWVSLWLALQFGQLAF